MESLAVASGTLRTKYGKPTACASINRPLILLLAYTGLRWGEAGALRVGRVDLDRRRIRVATTLSGVKSVLSEGLPKNGKRRAVPIPASLVAELRSLVDGRPDDAWLFTTARNMPRDVSFGEDASRVRTDAGPQVVASLRNLVISAFRLAGHANIAQTLRFMARDPRRPLALLGITT